MLHLYHTKRRSSWCWCLIFFYVESVFLKFFYQKPCLEKKRVLKHKKMAPKRAVEDKGQSKLSFFKTPRKYPEESRNATSVIVAESFGESSGVDQEAQRKEINEN